MDDPIPLNDNIQIAALQNIPTKDGEQVVVAGWGKTSVRERPRESGGKGIAPNFSYHASICHTGTAAEGCTVALPSH